MVAEHGQQGAQLGGDPLGADHDPGAPFEHLPIGTRIGCHTGRATGHRLQQRQRQPFHQGGQQEDLSQLLQGDPHLQPWFVAPPHHIPFFVVGLQGTAQGAIAHDQQHTAGGAHQSPGLQQGLHVFLGGHPAHVEKHPPTGEALLQLG